MHVCEPAHRARLLVNLSHSCLNDRFEDFARDEGYRWPDEVRKAALQMEDLEQVACVSVCV